MDIPKNLQLNAQTLILGNRSLNSSTEQVNIISSNGTEIKINGVVPGGGGDDSLPITGTGDIRITGDITALGDGLTNGRMEAQTIKSIDNLVISSGCLEVTTGGVDIKANGNLTLEGNGDINVLGTGNIGVGTGGVTSIGDISVTTGDLSVTLGDIQTNAGDIVSANNIYFDGDDIYHRTNNPVAQKTYKEYKQLVGLNDANVFTGANQFNDNTTEFAAKVSVGTRDAVSDLFTQNLALNTSGNIESKTINNGTIIQCGNINCGNAGLNEVRARQFKTRTNENNSPEGWTISQQTPSNPAENLDKSLVFKGGETNAFISILDSAHSGFVPNITLDPRNSTLGGLVSATVHQVGQGGEAYWLTQPNTGADADNLLIRAGLNEGSVKFKNNASNIDLAIIQKDSVTNQGRLYVPAIFFGTTGLHNSIVNDTSGADSLVLKVRQATASSKVEFLDNAAASIMEVKKTEIELGNTIPILFGAYSFRPIEITYAFTGAELDANPATLFNSLTTNFTRTNDNATVVLNDLGEGIYILSIDAGSSSGGTIGSSRFVCNFPYMVSALASGSFSFSGNFCNNITPPVGFVEPTLEGDGTGGPIGSTNYSFAFSSITGTETYNGTVKITRLSY